MSELDLNTESSPAQSSEPSSEQIAEHNPEQSPAPASSAPNFALATQPSYARTLFLDSQGLRPGWGLAFYAVTFLTLQRMAVELASSWDLGASGLWSMMLAELGSLVAAVIPAAVLTRVERRPWNAYGLPGKQAFGRLFWIGSLWGFAGISMLMFALFGLHSFAFGHVVLHGGRFARFALFWAVMFLLVGLFEEFLLRGYIAVHAGARHRLLARGVGFVRVALD